MTLLHDLRLLLTKSLDISNEVNFIRSIMDLDIEFYDSIIESLKEVLDENYQFKVKHKGLLGIPAGEKFYNQPLSHYIDIAKQVGYRPVSRALTNLMVLNRNKHKSISTQALNILQQLRLQVHSDRDKDIHMYREAPTAPPIELHKRVHSSQVGRVIDNLKVDTGSGNSAFIFKNGASVSRVGDNQYMIDNGTKTKIPALELILTRKQTERFIKKNADLLNNETDEYMDNMSKAYGDDQKSKPKVSRKYSTGKGTKSDNVKIHNVFRDLTDKESVPLSSGGHLVKLDKNQYQVMDVEPNSLQGQGERNDVLTKKDVEYLVKNNPNEFDGYRTV